MSHRYPFQFDSWANFIHIPLNCHPVADEFAVENSKRVIGELTQRMKKKVAPGKVNKNKRGE